MVQRLQHRHVQCGEFGGTRAAVLQVGQIDQRIHFDAAQRLLQGVVGGGIEPDSEQRDFACAPGVDQRVQHLGLHATEHAAGNQYGHFRPRRLAIALPLRLQGLRAVQPLAAARAVAGGRQHLRQRQSVGPGTAAPGLQVGSQRADVGLATVAVVAGDPARYLGGQVAGGRCATSHTQPRHLAVLQGPINHRHDLFDIGRSRRIQQHQVGARGPVSGQRGCRVHHALLEAHSCGRAQRIQAGDPAGQHEAAADHLHPQGFGLGTGRCGKHQPPEQQPCPPAAHGQNASSMPACT